MPVLDCLRVHCAKSGLGLGLVGVCTKHNCLSGNLQATDLAITSLGFCPLLSIVICDLADGSFPGSGESWWVVESRRERRVPMEVVTLLGVSSFEVFVTMSEN